MSVRHLEAIRAGIRDAGADALWVHPAVDFRYLTGLAPIAMERPTALVILADGGLRVLAPQMLAPELAIEGAEVEAWSDGDGPEAAIARVLDGVGQCLIEPDLPSGTAFALRAARPGLELNLDPGILAGLRERKAPDELEQLRAAGREADAAMEWVAGADLDGRSERWLALELQMRFLRPRRRAVRLRDRERTERCATAPRDRGDPDPGRRAAADRLRLRRGRLLLRHDARAPAADGGEAAEAYAIVRAAHDAVIAGLEPGLPCHEADRLARDVIEAAGHGERFIHRTGHGVGLEIHEEPYLRPGNPAPLQVGHVFSVEPGIYVPGRFGVRYENLVHLGADGPELLNRP